MPLLGYRGQAPGLPATYSAFRACRLTPNKWSPSTSFRVDEPPTTSVAYFWKWMSLAISWIFNFVNTSVGRNKKLLVGPRAAVRVSRFCRRPRARLRHKQDHLNNIYSEKIPANRIDSIETIWKREFGWILQKRKLNSLNAARLLGENKNR